MTAEHMSQDRALVARLDRAVERFKALLGRGEDRALGEAYRDVVGALRACRDGARRVCPACGVAHGERASGHKP